MNNTYPYIPDEFNGKRVLVTGGTKGAGKAIMRRFALAGASVATAVRSPLPERQKPALFVQVDLSSVEGIAQLADCIMKKWGGIDILVNCVGGSDAPNGGYAALTEEHWQSALNLNLMAAVRCNRHFLPGMIERKSGVILHISSIQHRSPLYDSTLPYATLREH